MNLLHVRFSLYPFLIRWLLDKFSRVKAWVTHTHIMYYWKYTVNHTHTQRNASHMYVQRLNKAPYKPFFSPSPFTSFSYGDPELTFLTPLPPVDRHHGALKLLKQPNHLLKHKLKTYTDAPTQNTNMHRRRSLRPNTHTDTDAHTSRTVHINICIHDFLIHTDGQSS